MTVDLNAVKATLKEIENSPTIEDQIAGKRSHATLLARALQDVIAVVEDIEKRLAATGSRAS